MNELNSPALESVEENRGRRRRAKVDRETRSTLAEKPLIRTKAREDWHPLPDRRGPAEAGKGRQCMLRPVGPDSRTGP
jgi:hypothetical protein